CLMIFLSEFADAPLLVCRLIRKLMRVRQADYLKNYADSDVLRAAQIRKMMDREIHRMHAFVRFQQGTDGFCYALVDPDFDELPRFDARFVGRFADMGWWLLDVRRGYGAAYDGMRVRLLDSLGAVLDPLRAQRADARLAGRETAFQDMWKAYFT